MEFGAHHRTQRLAGKSHFAPGVVKSVDALTYATSFVSLSFAVHQIWLIWSEQNASGVSLVLWTGFLLAHTVWALYGYVHGERVIMTVHAVWIVFCILILLGVVAFR